MLDLEIAAARHTEFADLFGEFIADYWPSEKGRQHWQSYEAARAAARDNLAYLEDAARRGEDVTAAVLDSLLPYADTPANREAHRWTHNTAVFASDVRVKYEASGWTDPADWPQVAQALLDFVWRCTADPAALPAACRDFAARPYAKGFQSGTLSPILNALRPECFAILNAKSRRVVAYFTGREYDPDLSDYADLNAATLALIEAYADILRVPDQSNARPGDLFDMFCHWLISVRHYDFSGPAVEVAHDAGEPFGDLFASREEAEWAFDLLRETLERLGVAGPDDARFAVTLRDGGHTLSLTFGKWTVLRFMGPCYVQFRVQMALMDEHLEVLGPYEPEPPFVTEGATTVRLYSLPWETVKPFPAALHKVYLHTLDYIAGRFGDWTATHIRHYHQPQIAEAVFDLAKRDALFGDWAPTGTGCPEPEAPALQPAEETAYPLAAESPTLHEAAESYSPQPPYALSQCAADVHMDEATVARWVRAVERKGQAIFYGPPGTGKTFIAEHLARHLVGGGDGFWELVQFHPAYAYEDFVQGLRPQSGADGALTYPLVPGRFLDFCARASRRRDRCVLILDEINRANLARVFGELMYLLEYRDRAIALAGGGVLRIPANARLVGTMNTADRSIALVDHALRRRFAFIALSPDYDILRRYHAPSGFPVEALIEVLQRLNAQIGDPHYHVGVAFFLHPELTVHLEDIWRMEIEPYLEEYFFDRPEKARAFRWEEIRLKVES
ncbi:MAG TPA: AAA family ATPase [Anaerolineae bacterium]|nr:AAA family ATPase [Anaerolineae bacterium]